MPENTDTLLLDSVNEGKMEDESTLPLEGNSHRPRKKHIYEQILKQLEFYMGDANLSKDRFLAQELKKCPQLPVDLFLKFNKIRNITNDVRDLVTALKKSNILELTDDLQKVFRKEELKPRENLDECTLYVENLPCDANHDWLTKIFRNYGNVLYVSIPKFKVSRYNKGFAFIEFDSPECVTKVLEAFGAAGCRLSANMPSDQLLSIKTFEDDAAKSLYPHAQSSGEHDTEESENKNKNLIKRKRLSDGQESSEPKKTKPQVDSVDPGREALGVSSTDIKQEMSESNKTVKEGASGVETEAKQGANQAMETDKKAEVGVLLPTVNANTVTKEETTVVADPMDTGEKDTVASGSSEEDDDDDMTEDDKNLRPRNRKNKKAKKKNKLEVSSLGLQVLSKLEWKRLRNKYLNLQREKMSELKKQARALALEEHKREMKAQALEEHKSQKKAHEQKQNGNASNYEFTPGVILKIEPEDFIEDIKQFKLDAKSNCGVVYVDIKPEKKNVYVRCRTTEAASELLSANTWPNCSLLQGDEEKDYWKKIEEDRATKFGMERKNERGRNKLLHRIKKLGVGQHPVEPAASSGGAAQHIRFQDSDDESPAVAPPEGKSPAVEQPQAV